MSLEIESAEQLFDILAGEDDEVPSTLIRGSQKLSPHEEALQEQAQMVRLNKVEEWMKTDKAVEADPAQFLSLGETLYTTLLKSRSSELSTSVVQKITKLALLWLKVTKSCKLIEVHVTPELVSSLLKKLMRAKSPHATIVEVCGRFLLGMVQSSPNRIFVDKTVIDGFNDFVRSWAKGAYRGNGFGILALFPVEFLSQLDWVPSSRHFTLKKITELVGRVLKRKLRVHVNLDAYVSAVSVEDQHARDMEETLIKLGGSLLRWKSVEQLTPGFLQWLSSVASRDLKAQGVSGRTVRLAKDLEAQIAKSRT